MNYGRLPRFAVKPVKGGKQSACEACGLRRVVRYFDGKQLCHPCEQDIRDSAAETA